MKGIKDYCIMMYLVIGGSNSGKSECAENLLSRISDVKYKYYVATMLNSDKAAEERIMRHRKLRKRKGFITIEQPKEITRILRMINAEKSAVLIECLTNLTANEMFENKNICAEEVLKKIKHDILVLRDKVRHLIVVSNNSFDEKYSYDEDTRLYIKTLFAINDEISALSDEVYVMGNK